MRSVRTYYFGPALRWLPYEQGSCRHPYVHQKKSTKATKRNCVATALLLWMNRQPPVHQGINHRVHYQHLTIPRLVLVPDHDFPPILLGLNLLSHEPGHSGSSSNDKGSVEPERDESGSDGPIDSISEKTTFEEPMPPNKRFCSGQGLQSRE